MRICKDLAGAVGNTPLIRLKKASELTGCEILGKAEFMNPGQSVKDRAALFIIRDAIARGQLKPGGTIVLSTPNLIWYPVVRLATIAGVRPYEGFENFSTWRGLRAVLGESGVRIEREKGVHPYPFQLGLQGLARWWEEHLQALRGLMINICVLGTKAPVADAAAAAGLAHAE